MNLQEFKNKFVSLMSELSDNFYEINEKLFSSSPELSENEDYSQYTIEGFCKQAISVCRDIHNEAARMYDYIVEDPHPVEDPFCDEEKELPSPLLRDLDLILSIINSISFCIGHSYHVLTNDYLEGIEEPKGFKETVETFTDRIIQYIEEQVEDSSYILEYLTIKKTSTESK